MTNIQDKIANLSPEQKELLLKHLAQKNSKNQNKITRHYGCQSYPASFTQTRFWFLTQLTPESPIYNMTKALKFSQELNVNTLHKTLNKIIARHETLRTVFHLENQELIQVITSNHIPELPLISLKNYSPENEQKIFEDLARQITEKPFNLAEDLMLRVTLFHLSSNDYILLLVTHHIISDNWSSQILTKELLTIYEALEKNQEIPLAELPIQYGDFAIWQKQRFDNNLYQKQLDYWREKLGGELPILNLPIDKQRPSIPSYQGDSFSFLLSEDLGENLKKLSTKEQVTLFMIFLAVFQVLLYRYTGQEDIIIGIPIAGRQNLETENLIGCFLNTLALRNNLNENLTFQELLQQVKKVSLEGYDNQDLPFEKLIEQLQPDRNLSQSPIFQVMFNFVNKLEDKFINCPSFLEILNLKTKIALFDLSIAIRQNKSEIEVTFNYSTDLFELEIIRRISSSFSVLLKEVVKNPNQKISKLSLLTETEKQQILIDWNRTKVDYPKDKCIYQLFEEQVIKTPFNIAVIFKQEKLTYQQLNEKANQLANYLIKQGVKLETKIAISCDRSLEMIIGILGILKAGGCYVPIDPNYPQERINYILEEGNINILLTQKKLKSKFNQKLFTVYLDEKNLFNQESKINPINQVKGNNLVYLLFTSGSTGKPKGVMMNHNSITNLIQWQISQTYSLIHRKTLQFSPISFDVSCQEIFSTLAEGSTLVLISEEERKDFNLLPKWLEEKSINRIFLPFVALEKLAEVIEDKSLTVNSLQEIITAGEALKLTLIIKKLRQKVKVIYNQYGPTETHVVTQFTLKKNGNIGYLPPIGKPINNTQLYILDKQLQPLPVGVTGELHIGGDGLARGYLNRPDLTAEKFIDNPFGEEKLYKTGDLARYLPDGNIEYIGRIDDQVKIRGFRVELGEIETVLNQHPNIQQTVVIVRENEQGEKHLVAYIIAKNNQPEIKELRQFLSQKLPDYMIPLGFIFVENFPLTHNGKIDKKALPKPDLNTNREEEFTAPRNETELKLANIWSEVLQLDKIGIHDNFFALGGHSLLAVKMVSRIRTIFQLEISLVYIFQYPTIGQLGDLLSDLILTENNNENLEIGEI
jgi:amino acid adenylation domain-containing protein